MLEVNVTVNNVLKLANIQHSENNPGLNSWLGKSFTGTCGWQ